MLHELEYNNLSEGVVMNISDRLYGFSDVLFHNEPGLLVIDGTDGGL